MSRSTVDGSTLGSRRRARSQPRPVKGWFERPPTSTQLEIIALIAEGLSYEEIATVRVVGKETIKRHVSDSLRRMDCRTSAQLVHLSWLRGYLPADEAWVRSQLSRLMSVRERNA